MYWIKLPSGLYLDLDHIDYIVPYPDVGRVTVVWPRVANENNQTTYGGADARAVLAELDGLIEDRRHARVHDPRARENR